MIPNSQSEKILHRMKSLLALATDAGASDNERELAQKRLNLYLKRYDMVVEDLLDEPRNVWAKLATTTAIERQLAVQVGCYVTKKRTISVDKRGNAYYIRCTEREKVEIERIYDTLRPVFNTEIDLTIRAFFEAHDLFSGEQPDDGEGEKVCVTEDMIQRWKKEQARARLIDAVPLHQQIGEGTNAKE